MPSGVLLTSFPSWFLEIQERDDAIELGARRGQRSGVGSGGPEEQRPVVAGDNVGSPADHATGGRDQGLLRGGREGAGRTLRCQVSNLVELPAVARKNYRVLVACSVTLLAYRTQISP